LCPGADGVFGTVKTEIQNSGDAGVHGIYQQASSVWGFQYQNPQAGPTDYGVWGDNLGTTAESAGVFGTVQAYHNASAGVSGVNGGPVSPRRVLSWWEPPAWIPAPIESPDVEFYANGEAQLKNGEAAVRFERLFREAISGEIPVRVVVTPVGSWSGLYIVSSATDGFVLKSGAGDPNV